MADLVGDNVGDIAGMGADLFGSFAESTCAALVIAAQNADLYNHGWCAICFPVLISAAGIFVCFLTSFIATNIKCCSPCTDGGICSPYGTRSVYIGHRHTTR